MNFIHGKIVSEADANDFLIHIGEDILRTLAADTLDVEKVLNACDVLANKLENLTSLIDMTSFGISQSFANRYQRQIGKMLCSAELRKRLNHELGNGYLNPAILCYPLTQEEAIQKITPLGVLFHITAGNMDVLPFFSLLEGLLTGNINILKLPQEEKGITLRLTQELIEIEPALQDYIYLFDYSSKDITAIKTLAGVSDAIVVWGGDAAIHAVRSFANPNTKIIEWGHKISFAYLTQHGMERENLEKLAQHICLTNQQFCSSCQGIFVDTSNMQDVYDFCSLFLPILEEVGKEMPLSLKENASLFAQAEITLKNYHHLIEGNKENRVVFYGQDCTLIACSDSTLSPSMKYRNLWVKPLPKENLITFRAYKNYLQTVGLLCSPEEYEELSRVFFKTGVVKICDGFHFSDYAFGEAHDGIFPLRCYTKVVSMHKTKD